MKRLLLGLVIAGTLAAQAPAPELVVIALRTAAVCQELRSLIPAAYVTCKPFVAAEGVNLPAGSAVRFTFAYTDSDGKPQVTTGTADTNQSGQAYWAYLPPTDFSAPNISAVLLVASGSVPLKQ